MDFARRVLAAIRQHALLDANQGVVVGVSGGPDSLCLLHVLVALRSEALPGLSLHVAHLNHDLRGPASDADAEFVAGLAAQWGLPATIEKVDVHALAAEQRLSLEEAGRQARYAFLAQVARRVNAERIAVAHNADDQAETVLMHFLRGSGVAGLRGMQFKSQLPTAKPQLSTSNVQLPNPNPQLPITNPESPLLIRPLLEIPRADIETYCTEHSLQPRSDRSNLDLTFFRNRLRHEVLPFLENVSPGLRDRLRRMAEVMAGDYATLEQVLSSARALAVLAETPQAITFDLAALRGLPLGVQRALVRDSVARLRADLRDIAFAPVEAAVRLAQTGLTGAQAPLPGGLALTLGYDTAVLAAEAVALPDIPLLSPGAQVPVAVPGLTPLPGTAWALRAETGRWPLETVRADDDPWQAFVPWDAPRPLHLRPRRPGDRFQPQGLGGAEPKLSDFMIGQKVPRAWRDRLPLLAAGEVIWWVCGWRVSEAAAVTGDTPQMLRLQFERKKTDTDFTEGHG